LENKYGIIINAAYIAAWFLKRNQAAISILKEVFQVNEKDYCSELYEKMKAEQDKYRDWLLTKEPSEILNHTYEYTMREDIVMAMEDLELSPKRAKALLKSPCPLSDVYEEFKDRETEHMDTIRDSIESRADTVLKREAAKESR
jgi:hypothetical protein